MQHWHDDDTTFLIQTYESVYTKNATSMKIESELMNIYKDALRDKTIQHTWWLQNTINLSNQLKRKSEIHEDSKKAEVLEWFKGSQEPR